MKEVFSCQVLGTSSVRLNVIAAMQPKVNLSSSSRSLFLAHPVVFLISLRVPVAICNIISPLDAVDLHCITPKQTGSRVGSTGPPLSKQGHKATITVS